MRYVLGVAGIFAAATLLLVSAAMNWRFGYSLGKSEFDSQIYGAASAAADCLKALLPFLILAAMRNRNWSQAVGGLVLLTICASYSLTSSLGFAALNRADTMGARAVRAQTYQDLTAELERIRKEMSWLPKHRPAGVVESEIASMKQNRRWRSTAGCTNATVKPSIEYCKAFHALQAELAAAMKSAALDKRLADVRAQLHQVRTAIPADQPDPQAAVLASLSGLATGKVQLALVILVSLLVEAGSALGLYVAFSHWRLAEPVRVPEPAPIVPAQITKVERNEPAVIKTDVEQYFEERVEEASGSSVTALSLFEDYCNWCDIKDKVPVSLPIFGRQFADLGIQKAKIGGRIRYIGIRLLSDVEDSNDQEDGLSISA